MSTVTSASSTSASSTSASSTSKAKTPVAAPAATGVSVVLAVGLIALGIVAIRDALIDGGALAGAPWITPALDYLDGLTAQTWMLPAGVGIAVVGALLIIAALKPRKRTHQPLRTQDTWIASRDISRVARATATNITGVASATVSGSTRQLTVEVTPLAGFDRTGLTETVRANVSEALAPLVTVPRIKTRIKEQDPS